MGKWVSDLQVLTISNQKGGVGKTTTAVALGGLAAQAGRRVLLVDLDPQGSMSAYFSLNPDKVENSSYHLFIERKSLSHSLVSNLICHTCFERISLMAASAALATLERQGIGDGMGLVLGKALPFVSDNFDLVILDCPPQLGILMVNALAACDELLMPVQTEFLAIKGLERMLHTLDMMSRSRQRDLSYLIVPTMYDRRTHASVSSLRIIRNTYGASVWPGKIPIDTKLRDASKAGIPPNLYEENGRGVTAYTSLYHYLGNQSNRVPTLRNQGA